MAARSISLSLAEPPAQATRAKIQRSTYSARMAQKSGWARFREGLKNLSATVVLIVGFFGVLGTLAKGISGFVQELASEWHAMRNSADVQEMASDVASGTHSVFAYLMDRWWEICVVISVVVVAHYARMKLVVRPRESEREAFVSAQKERNPGA